MKIATPTITDFDKEDIAPWEGNRLIDLHMATLPSKPITRFFLNHKQKKSLGYQKLRPRYEPMDEITQPACEPLCPEGWYFDCETETCKEKYIINTESIFGPVGGYINLVLGNQFAGYTNLSGQLVYGVGGNGHGTDGLAQIITYWQKYTYNDGTISDWVAIETTTEPRNTPCSGYILIPPFTDANLEWN